METIQKIIACLQQENWQDCILKYRKSSLVVAGVFGLILAIAIHHLIGFLSSNTETLQSNLTILALGIPTFFTLWLFRTHDVQRQIDKTQESINNDTFFECAKMLTMDDSSSVAPCSESSIGYFEDATVNDSLYSKSAKHQYGVALEQLAYLRRETGFDKKRIDSLTYSLSLQKKDLRFAQLHSVDLSQAKLKDSRLVGACLEMARLCGANLQGVDFVGANLRNADLSYSDLRNADLRDANLEGAKFKKTKYNAETEKKFPEGFTPDGKGMDYQLT